MPTQWNSCYYGNSKVKGVVNNTAVYAQKCVPYILDSIGYQTCTPNKQPTLQLETEATEVDVFMVLHPNAAQGLHGYESALRWYSLT